MQTSPDSSNWTLARGEARLLCGLGLLAFCLRLLVPLSVGADEHLSRGYIYYVEMADHVVEGSGFHRRLPFGHGERYAIRTPVYPLCLALFRVLPGDFEWTVILFGALCGTVTVLAVTVLARRLFGSIAAVLTGLGVALWPHSVLHDTALQDTALYAALFALSLLLAWRMALGPREEGRGMGRAVVLGFVLALAILTRVALLPSAGLLMAWLALDPGRLGARASRKFALGVAFSLAFGLSPWIARNAIVVGAPALTTDTGRSMWLGNNEETFSVYPAQSIDRAEERAWLALSEETRAEVRSLAGDERVSDAWFRQRALDYIWSDIPRALGGGLRKAWATFTPWFNPVGSAAKQAVHALSYGPVLLLALLALYRERRRFRELAPLVFCLALLALQSAVFFGHSSYRSYLDPLLIALAASVVASWPWLSGALRRLPGLNSSP